MRPSASLNSEFNGNLYLKTINCLYFEGVVGYMGWSFYHFLCVLPNFFFGFFFLWIFFFTWRFFWTFPWRLLKVFIFCDTLVSHFFLVAWFDCHGNSTSILSSDSACVSSFSTNFSVNWWVNFRESFIFSINTSESRLSWWVFAKWSPIQIKI